MRAKDRGVLETNIAGVWVPISGVDVKSSSRDIIEWGGGYSRGKLSTPNKDMLFGLTEFEVQGVGYGPYSFLEGHAINDPETTYQSSELGVGFGPIAYGALISSEAQSNDRVQYWYDPRHHSNGGVKHKVEPENILWTLDRVDNIDQSTVFTAITANSRADGKVLLVPDRNNGGNYVFTEDMATDLFYNDSGANWNSFEPGSRFSKTYVSSQHWVKDDGLLGRGWLREFNEGGYLWLDKKTGEMFFQTEGDPSSITENDGRLEAFDLMRFDLDSGKVIFDKDGGNYEYCFPAGTQISTPSGSKAIEDIRIGDSVLSFYYMGDIEERNVTNIFRTPQQKLVRLRNGLEVTPGHLLLTGDGQFKKVEDLVSNVDFLVKEDGYLTQFDGFEIVEGTHDVFNFEVDELHTYVAHGIRVHNRSTRSILIDNRAKGGELEVGFESHLDERTYKSSDFKSKQQQEGFRSYRNYGGSGTLESYEAKDWDGDGLTGFADWWDDAVAQQKIQEAERRGETPGYVTDTTAGKGGVTVTQDRQEALDNQGANDPGSGKNSVSARNAEKEGDDARAGKNNNANSSGTQDDTGSSSGGVISREAGGAWINNRGLRPLQTNHAFAQPA